MFTLSPHRRETSRYCKAIGRFGWYRVPNASNVRQIPSRDFGFELKILPIAELLPAIKVSLSRASEFGCEFGWPRARGGCLGGLGSHTGGKWAKCQVSLSPAQVTPSFSLSEFGFPGQPHLKFRGLTPRMRGCLPGQPAA